VTSYWAIMTARARTLLQYRAAAVAGLATQLVFGLIRVMIFSAFFASTAHAQPMSRTDVISYVWLGQAVFYLMLLGTDQDVTTMIRSGTVVYELLRPMDLYWVWFVRAVALRSVPTVMRGVPVIVFAALFFGLKPPPSVASGLAFAGSLLGALVIASAFTALMSISMMWTVSGLGITRIVPGIAYCLSGIIIPLPFFPDWAQPVLNALPFRHLVDTPFRLYLGHISPEQAPAILLQELVWTAALIMLGRLLLSRGARRLVAQGG
jgi:ABC-2 type transport system permease protein